MFYILHYVHTLSHVEHLKLIGGYISNIMMFFLKKERCHKWLNYMEQFREETAGYDSMNRSVNLFLKTTFWQYTKLSNRHFRVLDKQMPINLLLMTISTCYLLPQLLSSAENLVLSRQDLGHKTSSFATRNG